MATASTLGRVALRATRDRLPLTASLTAAVLAAGVATGGLWTPIVGRPFADVIGYGPSGRWWSLLSRAFFADQPAAYLPLLAVLVVGGGFVEWRLGTRRALVAGAVAHLAGVGGAALLVRATAGHGWDWTTGLATRTDLGTTTAVLGAAAATSATLSPSWRLRLRALLLGYAALSLVLAGGLTDLERLLGVVAGLAFGPALASVRPTRRAARADRRFLTGLALVTVAGLHLTLAAERWPLVLAGTGSAPERAATSMLLHQGSAVLVPVLLGVAAAGVWGGGRRAAWLALAGVALVTATHAAPLPALAEHHTLWWALAVLAVVVDALLLAAVAALVVPGHVRPSAPDPREERDLVRHRLRALGSTNRLAWMTTWPQNHWFHGRAVQGYLAHRLHAGVAIGLCDPVAVDEVDRTALLREFAERAHRRGLVPCVFAASAETAAAAATMGWRIMPVGEEAVVELPGLTFQGKAWQDVRTAVNHAARHGIVVELARYAELSDDVRRQVAEISRGWTSGRRLPELRFTLGGLDEAADPEVRVAVAVGPEGRVHGVVSWLPAHGPSGAVTGWTLDVMRRRADGFRPVMELLIATSLVRFRDEGCFWASLSASPLARSAAQPNASQRTAGIDLVLQHVAARLEPFYGFRSLHAFKAKFSPRFEPLYLAYPADVALPRISVALTRAYLPDVRLRDLAALRPGRATTASSPRSTSQPSALAA